MTAVRSDGKGMPLFAPNNVNGKNTLVYCNRKKKDAKGRLTNVSAWKECPEHGKLKKKPDVDTTAADTSEEIGVEESVLDVENGNVPTLNEYEEYGKVNTDDLDDDATTEMTDADIRAAEKNEKRVKKAYRKDKYRAEKNLKKRQETSRQVTDAVNEVASAFERDMIGGKFIANKIREKNKRLGTFIDDYYVDSARQGVRDVEYNYRRREQDAILEAKKENQEYVENYRSSMGSRFEEKLGKVKEIEAGLNSSIEIYNTNTARLKDQRARIEAKRNEIVNDKSLNNRQKAARLSIVNRGIKQIDNSLLTYEAAKTKASERKRALSEIKNSLESGIARISTLMPKEANLPHPNLSTRRSSNKTTSAAHVVYINAQNRASARVA